MSAPPDMASLSDQGQGRSFRPGPLDTKKLLVVEGKQDVAFFKSFLEHLVIDDIDVEPAGSKNELNIYLRALVTRRGFSKVRSLGIVRDANGWAERALQSVQGFLRRSGLPVPASYVERKQSSRIGVSVFILPDNGNPGMLETLLWRTLDRDFTKCVTDFLTCAQDATGSRPRNLDKARVATYLATRRKPPHSLGVSARQGVWDYDHEVLADLRRFLRQL